MARLSRKHEDAIDYAVEVMRASGRTDTKTRETIDALIQLRNSSFGHHKRERLVQMQKEKGKDT